jgi:hypothetical protein
MRLLNENEQMIVQGGNGQEVPIAVVGAIFCLFIAINLPTSNLAIKSLFALPALGLLVLGTLSAA